VSAPGPLTLTARDGDARLGTLQTAHGLIRLPAFMPVGTHASVKACHPDEVRAAGADVILANAYHLALRPGVELVESLGGLHAMMGWSGPILTDSGGYQLVSLSRVAALDDDGATFVSPYDGDRLRVTPEDSVRTQARLGADICMVLDHPVAFGASGQATTEAMARTHAWAARGRAVHPGGGRLLFGIVQGGFDVALRRLSAGVVAGLDFDGVAIGGLALGESPPVMEAMARAALEAVPEALPRYVMGLGSDAGVDMFDCVLPTRLARTGTALTSTGRLSIRRSRFRDDTRPLEEGCPCPACERFSRGCLRHLYKAGELLAHRLLSLHNLTHLGRLMAGARSAIAAGAFDAYRADVLGRLAGGVAAADHFTGSSPALR